MRYPLIVSSSLDCSLRIWNIFKGTCIKEFYLYNPVNYFQIDKTCMFVGLGKYIWNKWIKGIIGIYYLFEKGAGKIIYLNNLTQISTLKAFDDNDSVCCVKVRNKI